MGLTPERLAELLEAQAAALELFAGQWSQAPADVVQEAFVELARQPEVPQNTVGWLYRVVRNRAASEARSARRRKRRESAVAAANEAWFQTPERGDLGQTRRLKRSAVCRKACGKCLSHASGVN